MMGNMKILFAVLMLGVVSASQAEIVRESVRGREDEATSYLTACLLQREAAELEKAGKRGEALRSAEQALAALTRLDKRMPAGEWKMDPPGDWESVGQLRWRLERQIERLRLPAHRSRFLFPG
jgi:hypothetical protein